MSSFGEVLSHFKKSESPENIIALVEDQDLRIGLVAWKSVKIRFKSNAECEDKDDVDRWNWLWDMVEYDEGDYGIVAGVPVHQVHNLLKRLRGLRLIYPDGKISHFATQYLQGIVVSKLPKIKKTKDK